MRGSKQHEQEMQRAAAMAVQMQEELQEKLKLRELEHVEDRDGQIKRSPISNNRLRALGGENCP